MMQRMNRRSRAGGNPILYALSTGVQTWIPAFAGMTVFGLTMEKF
jgi:hypothetical protein